ncbi:sigma-E factor negative regulatory protein [Methylococcus sp. EFPC2]|uniref:sigma-E factor negative regulatory protein n=1 Tax=Methylococcus sp. EFPC2 TaxID=2812648 RepID=UPI001967D4D2|nr:sigma-E factor negative regulatory protein [Methylococcus sp. EFPC2]QSA98347.1 sigma-E factor negative regulatory protein [Methylococcus sp. EFPC2]
MSYDEMELKQRISMLMDSELSAQNNPELIRRIENDEGLTAAWARYHLIAEVMRNRESLVLADDDFAKRVRDAVSVEPLVAAFPRKRSADHAWKHRIVTLALAASLASVAVLVGYSIHENAQGLTPLEARNAPYDDAAHTPDARSPESLADAQFNDYLRAHNETAAMSGAAGMLPHVRLVSVRAER